MTTTLYQPSGRSGYQEPIDIGRGRVYGAQPFGSYGEKTTAGADSGVVWPDGAFVFPPSAGVQMSVVSTSVNDINTTGSGIRTIDIHYLDNNLVENVETVALNGTTPVLTVATNIRFIQCMHMVTFGSGKMAAGTITAANGGNIHSQINIGRHRCTSSVRMVPAGKRLLVTSMFAGSASGTAAASAIIRLSTPNFDGHNFITDGVFISMFSAPFQDSSGGLTLHCPIPFTEGQVVGMTFTVDKAATISASWFGWLEDI